MDEYQPNTDKLEDTHYDVIISGTGLEESILAASLARSGLKVLHIDPNTTYGGNWGSYPLSQFLPMVKEAGGLIKEYSSAQNIQNKVRDWNIDLTPKGIASGGSLVELLIQSNVGRYLEFKVVDRNVTFIEKNFVDLPSSRSSVFKSKFLALMERRRLMQLLQYCGDKTKLSDDQKHKPFLSFLKNDIKMSEKLISLVCFSILTLDSNETNITTEQAIEELTTVMESVGRYGQTNMLYTRYGVSEICQAMCRVCAIYRGIYVLRRGVREVLIQDGKVEGLVCSAGQKFVCKHFVTLKSCGFYKKVGESEEKKEEKKRLQWSKPTESVESRAILISFSSLFSSLPPELDVDADLEMESQQENQTNDQDANTTKEKKRQRSPYQTIFSTIPPSSLAPSFPKKTVKVYEVTRSTVSCPEDLYTIHFTQTGGDLEEVKKVVSYFFDVETGLIRDEFKKRDEGGEEENEQKSNGDDKKEQKEEEKEEGNKEGIAYAAYFTTPLSVFNQQIDFDIQQTTEATKNDLHEETIPKGVHLLSMMEGEVTLDACLHRAKTAFHSVMELEVKNRASSSEESTKEEEVPFVPDVFFPPLPQQVESGVGAHDEESYLLGLDGTTDQTEMSKEITDQTEVSKEEQTETPAASTETDETAVEQAEAVAQKHNTIIDKTEPEKPVNE